jgi:hypothetical protein
VTSGLDGLAIALDCGARHSGLQRGRRGGTPALAFILGMYIEVAEDLADSAMEALDAYISGLASEDRRTRPSGHDRAHI